MQRLSDTARTILAEKVQRYHAELLSEPTPSTAREYLKGRGFDRDATVRFQLGKVAGEEIGYDWLDDLLVIPYLTPAGPVAMKYRCLADHICKEHGHPKYLAEVGSDVHLFNAQTMIEAAGPVVIVEGEIDVMCIETMAGGGLPTVGYPGVEMWEKYPHFRRCLDGAERKIVVADGDKVNPKTGERPGLEAAKIVTRSLDDATMVVMPEGYDSNSFVLEFGPEEFVKRLGL